LEVQAIFSRFIESRQLLIMLPLPLQCITALKIYAQLIYTRCTKNTALCVVVF